ncbi:CBS domain protein [Oesophagostomum dentatum]|uniref:CBS domain protein n=1 Tax=Oesophagostomum dentatum TaxID=61180 RepID=A0A0B1TA84_OESDE|nr:CBS domain protein [Oesophagostomum dentatum]
MVSQSSRTTPNELLEPQPSQQQHRKKSKKAANWVAQARSRATGTLRRTLFGQKSKSARARDAESIIPEEDEDYTQTNYDTVKSLPATGHYGKSRVGHHLHVDVEGHLGLPPVPHFQQPVIILKLPKRRQSVQPCRISPVARFAVYDPTFDFHAWQTALDETEYCQDAVYSLFMKAHKCYDLIPTSTKLVVFDTQLPVRKAFFALVYNGVRAAPLWDSQKQRFIGMLTITDFIKILIKHYEAGDKEEKMRALEEEQISHWREQFESDEGGIRPLVTIDPSESLHRAVQVLCESKVHRLPVMDKHTGNISYILTHKRLIKFLNLYLPDLPRPAFMDSTPKELGIGSWGDIVTIHVDTPLHDALEIFLHNRVSALPLVDENGRVVDIYAKFDVISLAAEKSYDRLDCTVQEALKHRSECFEGVQCCSETDSLYDVLRAIVKAEVHRFIVTDADKKVVGIISLSDILKYLILDPVHNAELEGASTQKSSFPSIDDSPPIEGIPEGVED